ncbi:unnamed protein product, partial [Medioppia subpectinata]
NLFIIGKMQFFVHLYRGLVIAFRDTFMARKQCESKRRLDGQVVVITGANTGIGKETAYQMTLRGAKVIIGCRDESRAENAIKDIKQRNPKADIYSLPLDLSSLQSVRQFVTEITKRETKVDILINNAGIAFTPEWATADGFEMAFGTNHLGHYLLTLSLLPLMKQSIGTGRAARVVNVSSCIHALGNIHFENINLRNGAYHPQKAYAQSKLANVLFTRELARRLGSDSGVNSYSLHPGAVQSEGARHMTGVQKFLVNIMLKVMAIDVVKGCQTSLYCALDEGLDNESGFYYDNCQRIDAMVSTATDDKSAQQLWQLSEELVRLEDHLKLSSNTTGN